MSDTVDREAEATLAANVMDVSDYETYQGPFRTSKDIGEIAPAFCRAQAKFESARKASANPAYHSKYADLSAIVEAALPALNGEDIAVLQPAQLNGKSVTVLTRLLHKSGQYFESDLTMPAVMRDRFDAQSVGSAITYARRYSLQALICLAADDDDGNAASGVGSKEAAQAVAKRKIDEHNAKKAAATVVPAIFFRYFEQSHTAQVSGDSELLEANRDLFEEYVTTVKGVRAIIVTDEQMENLKHSLEQRKIEYRVQKAA